MPVAATMMAAGIAKNWLMTELQTMHVGQVPGAHLHRDREHHGFGEGRAEADHHGGDVEKDREIDVGDRKWHSGPSSVVTRLWAPTYPAHRFGWVMET